MDHEHNWDQLLRIKTCGRDESHADQYHHPYEPTPYSVLERLEHSGLIGPENVVLDYGCGKGRVGIFLAHRINAKVIGIEYDPHIYQNALENGVAARTKAEFALARAEEFPVPAEADRCYFFNPFSVEILKKVMARILESYYDEPREILLFFYYPSDDFVAYLMTVDALDFYDEIECDDLFPGKDNRERILIFQLPGL
jgi:SAM-dependent methyltransferase